MGTKHLELDYFRIILGISGIENGLLIAATLTVGGLRAASLKARFHEAGVDARIASIAHENSSSRRRSKKDDAAASRKHRLTKQRPTI